MMKETNITTAILSISTPGTYLRPFDAPLTKEISRTTNVELSEICAAHPGHFRFFASLPLPSVPDSLAEIDYALDTLGAVGFCVLSNANGVYMGDKALDPIFDKLNELLKWNGTLAYTEAQLIAQMRSSLAEENEWFG